MLFARLCTFVVCAWCVGVFGLFDSGVVLGSTCIPGQAGCSLPGGNTGEPTSTWAPPPPTATQRTPPPTATQQTPPPPPGGSTEVIDDPSSFPYPAGQSPTGKPGGVYGGASGSGSGASSNGSGDLVSCFASGGGGSDSGASNVTALNTFNAAALTWDLRSGGSMQEFSTPFEELPPAQQGAAGDSGYGPSDTVPGYTYTSSEDVSPTDAADSLSNGQIPVNDEGKDSSGSSLADKNAMASIWDAGSKALNQARRKIARFAASRGMDWVKATGHLDDAVGRTFPRMANSDDLAQALSDKRLSGKARARMVGQLDAELMRDIDIGSTRKSRAVIADAAEEAQYAQRRLNRLTNPERRAPESRERPFPGTEQEIQAAERRLSAAQDTLDERVSILTGSRTRERNLRYVDDAMNESRGQYADKRAVLERAIQNEQNKKNPAQETLGRLRKELGDLKRQADADDAFLEERLRKVENGQRNISRADAMRASLDLADVLRDLRDHDPGEFEKVMGALRREDAVAHRNAKENIDFLDRNPHFGPNGGGHFGGKPSPESASNGQGTCGGNAVAFLAGSSSAVSSLVSSSGFGFLSSSLTTGDGLNGRSTVKLFGRPEWLRSLVTQATAELNTTLVGSCRDEDVAAVPVGDHLQVDVSSLCDFENADGGISYRLLDGKDVAGLSSEERVALFRPFGIDSDSGQVLSSSVVQELMSGDVNHLVKGREDTPFVLLGGKVSLDKNLLGYEAPNREVTGWEDVVFVQARDSAGSSRVIPVRVLLDSHSPQCGNVVDDLVDRYGKDSHGQVTGGIAGTGSASGGIVVERGSRVSVDGSGCFDEDLDGGVGHVGVSHDALSVASATEDGQSFLNVSSGYLGDAGSVTVSAVDEGDRKGVSSVPVVVGDVPFVCQTVKGRVVVRVRSGGDADMKLSCGLKYGVRPIASVSVSGGAAEDRFGEFVPRVDQATGDVSLRVSVNDGVVGTFTRSLLLRNGDISVRVPVDVVVDDPTQPLPGGGSSEPAGAGGKYSPPADTPGPTAPVPGGGKAGDGTLSPSPSGTKKPAKTGG